MFLPQEALVAAETNSKEVKKHNQQVNTRIVFVDRSALVQWVVHLGSKSSAPGSALLGQDICAAFKKPLFLDSKRLKCWNKFYSCSRRRADGVGMWTTLFKSCLCNFTWINVAFSIFHIMSYRHIILSNDSYS